MALTAASPVRGGPAVGGRGSTREGRLSVDAAQLYPWIRPGEWQPAAVLADRVLAGHLLHGVYDLTRGRALPEAHFEFRGGSARGGERSAARPRREDRPRTPS